MAKDKGTIIVVGAGIGGLTAALALRQFGYSPVLLEQAAEFGEVGAGLQLGPNATRTLAALGRLEAVEAVANAPECALARSWDEGRDLREIPYGAALRRRFGYPYLHLYRPDLLAVLVAGLAPGVARLGARVVAIEEEDGRAGARLADGAVLWGDGVVGADGIHSLVREYLHGPARAHFTGNMAWRGLCPGDAGRALGVRPVSGLWWGPGRHFVHYFVAGGRYLNWVGVVPHDGAAIESWTASGEIADAQRDFAGWHEQIGGIIQATPRANKWALHDRDPLAFWSRGRVTLLGDACHPMLPFMAQGAAQAIEDAYVLGRCLAAEADAPAAFARYERNRLERTAWVQGGSRHNSVLFHLSDPDAVAERDQRLAAEVAANPDGVSADQSRLFGYDPVSDPLAP